MLLFIIGPSASGKGTQAELLANKYNILHISIGELLREEIVKHTELGMSIEPMIKSGRFVPGTATEQILRNSLLDAFSRCNGAVVDGFPRIYEQAFEIQPVVDKHTGWFRVIHYILSYEECLRRQKNREQSGKARMDDNVLQERYNSYMKEIDLITSYYKNKKKLIEIDARPAIEEVFNTTRIKLEESLEENGEN